MVNLKDKLLDKYNFVIILAFADPIMHLNRILSTLVLCSNVSEYVLNV